MKPIYLMMILAFGITNAQIRTTAQSISERSPETDLNYVPEFNPYDGTYQWPDVKESLTLEMMIGEEIYVASAKSVFADRMPKNFEEGSDSMFTYYKAKPNAKKVEEQSFIVSNYTFMKKDGALNRYDSNYTLHILELSHKDNPKSKIYYVQKGNSDFEATEAMIPVKYFNQLANTVKGQKLYIRKNVIQHLENPYMTYESDSVVFTVVDVTVDKGLLGTQIVYIVEDPNGKQGKVLARFNKPDFFDKYEFNGDLSNIRGNAIVPEIYTEAGYSNLVSRFGTEGAERILNQKIKVGMSIEELIRSWDVPKSINRSSYGPAQWVYGDSQFVYTEGGKVTDWN